MRKPAWLAEVLVQSVMIVLSILLALWVDEWKQHSAEQRLAEVSLSNFLHEVQQNQARLDDILPYHRGVRSMVKQLETGHLADKDDMITRLEFSVSRAFEAGDTSIDQGQTEAAFIDGDAGKFIRDGITCEASGEMLLIRRKQVDGEHPRITEGIEGATLLSQTPQDQCRLQ